MSRRLGLFLCLLLVLLAFALSPAAESKTEEKARDVSAISLYEDMGDAMATEAARVREELGKQAGSLFARKPLGWNVETVHRLRDWVLTLPDRIPQWIDLLMEQARLLGLWGSVIMLVFILAVLYSLFGRKRALSRIEREIQPLRQYLPEGSYPFFFSALRVVVAALIPLLLLGLYSLINAMIVYKATWFLLAGRVFLVWALGALVIGILRESLTAGLFSAADRHGRTTFRLARLVVLYVLAGVILVWAAQSFRIPKDVQALLEFAIALSVVCLLFLLLLRKRAMMSLFPELPYSSYRGFIRLIGAYYHPLIILSFALSVLWCFGYKDLGRVVLSKLWAAAGAYLLIMLIYHSLLGWLRKWSEKAGAASETTQSVFRSLKSLLLYATVIATIMVVLNLVGLLHPLQRVMSFPVLKLGGSPVTLWIIVKAFIILLAFVYGSRVLQAYLDHKVYPAVGVDEGLAYALNTLIGYTTFVIGGLISLGVVGIDLRFLLIFAGAAGIGLGLGLQHMAANMLSGLSIIFGRKIRKGDWIEVEGTLGLVTDIYLRATKVRSRDNIEYLIPNSDLISKTVINYSMSSPFVRLAVPLGVSYGSDPRQVEKILLETAGKEPMVSDYEKPSVRFVGYGESSIDFELLVWIDIRATPRRTVSSVLFFAIFDALKAAGIEIPFPQRDIHIRSGPIGKEPFSS